MLKSIILTAALIAPNATETTAPAPEESTPVIIQDQETTEEATALTVEETPAPVEEQTTETPPLYATPEEEATATATEEATAPETAINAPYFNKKPYQGITIITCEY